MNKNEIIDVLRALHTITGFRVSLHGANYEEIAAFPEEKCKFCRLVQRDPTELQKCIECDSHACRIALGNKDTYIYKCRYGLTEAISPLYNFGQLTGFLMMGQTRTSDKDMATADILFKRSAERDEIWDAIGAVPITNGDLVDSYVRIMTVCARYLTLSNSVASQKPSIVEATKSYVHDNFSEKIGIAELCRTIGCSKSTLIKLFKEECGMTVGAYIAEVRLSEAERLLTGSDASMCEIARECGFCDQSYFSKVFVAKHGISPSDYRNQKQGRKK